MPLYLSSDCSEVSSMSPAERKLDQNYRWFRANHKRLLRRYRGRYIAVAQAAVVGDYPTEDLAICETVRSGIRPGEFIVQRCVPVAEEERAVFHSGVSFPKRAVQK
jgi:hypothetical protein